MSNILDRIVEKFGGQKYEDHYVAILCQFHDDQKPSMMVYQDSYICLACGATGKTDELLKRDVVIPTTNYFSTAKISNPFTGWLYKFELFEIIDIAHRFLVNNPHYATYLTNGRKITLETCKALHIGVMDNWFTFPIYNKDGELAGAVARIGDHGKERIYMLPKGQDPNLVYIPSWDRLAESTKFYLVFGIIDAVTLYQMGYACGSTTTGKRLDASVLDGIRKQIVIIPDIGEELDAIKISKNLGWRGKVHRLPQNDLGFKDVNDYYKNAIPIGV